MDLDIEKCLKSWDLEELADICKEHHIDMKSLHLLNLDSLKVIPQIGLRLRFWEKIQAFVKPSLATEKFSDVQVPSPLTSEASTSSSFSLIELSEAEEETSSTLNYDVDSFVGEPGPPTKKPKIRNESCVFIKKLLESSIKGQYVLAYYEKHGIFNKESRQKLVEILVDYLLDKDITRRVPSAELNSLAINIQQMFPSENKDTYFTVVTHNNKNIGKGKLCQRYYNLRRRFADVGLIEKSKKQDNSETTDDIFNDKDEYVKWLENSMTPWATVLKYWDETYYLRKQSLTKQCEIHDYFKQFPALSSENGYELLEQDFLKLYPDRELALFANFDKIAEAFEKYLKLRKDKNLRTKVEDYLNEKSTETKNLKLLLLLPYLLVPVTVKKNKECQWRPSRLEVAEAFILHVTDVGKIQHHIENRRTTLAKWKTTLQPFIIIVGQNLCEITDIYIQIDQISFRLPGILKALDVTFKTFFALNAQYPPEAEQLWILIEKLFYAIEESPNKFTAVTTLVTDIRNLMKP